jgi:hypothetical protein
MADRAAAGVKRGRAGQGNGARPPKGARGEEGRVPRDPKAKRLEALAKFFGDIWKVIALVDSRHDFGSMSQDTYVKIGGATFDFLRNFANNIQRIVLFGDDDTAKELSHHLTSICKGRIVMGSGPEDPFIEYTEIQLGLPNTPEAKDAATWNRIRNSGAARSAEDWVLNQQASTGWNGGINDANAPTLGAGFTKYIVPAQFTVNGDPNNPESWNLIRDTEADFKQYHKAIAKVLGWTEEANSPIPVIIDTTKTLHKFSYPYFLPTIPMESYADPSPTSSIDWPYVAIEVGGQPRDYTINGVHFRINSPAANIEDITIEYRIGDPEARGPPTATYNFGNPGIKPNAIEVCKGNINDSINEVITVAAGNTGRYQTIGAAGAGAVAAYIAMFDANCGIYRNLSYPDEGGGLMTDARKKQIILPFIAKRGGDTLQGESCKKSKRHIIKRTRGVLKPAGRVGPYKYEHVPINIAGALAGAGEEIEATINNYVFLTYDRVAAMYAVLRGITTILQTGSKDAIIYKKEGINFGITYTTVANQAPRIYTAPAMPFPDIPNRREGAAGGAIKSNRISGGAPCTRTGAKINTQCFYNNLTDLCTPFGPLYDAFTLLDMLGYFGLINNIPELKDISKNKKLQLCGDRCIRNIPSMYEAVELWEDIMCNVYTTNIMRVATELMVSIAYTIYYSLIGSGAAQDIIIEAIRDLYTQIYATIDINNWMGARALLGGPAGANVLANQIRNLSNTISHGTANRGVIIDKIEVLLQDIINIIGELACGFAIPAAAPTALMLTRANRIDFTVNEIINELPVVNGVGGYILQIKDLYIRYTAALQGVHTININGRDIQINGVVGAEDYISLIETLRGQIRGNAIDLDGNPIDSSIYIGKYGLPINPQGGGGPQNASKTFYDTWGSIQTIYDERAAHNLFYKFIYLLAICENLYFSQRDSADNFYVYNSVPIRRGGHTQVTMSAFIERLIAAYKAAKSNARGLSVFLQMFVHFPYLLQKYKLDGVLIDIKEYIRVWFEYVNVNIKEIESPEVDALFKTIIVDTLKKADAVQKQLSANDEECADYLYTVFPHGLFVLQCNSISGAGPVAPATNYKMAVNSTRAKLTKIANSKPPPSIAPKAPMALTGVFNALFGPPNNNGYTSAATIAGPNNNMANTAVHRPQAKHSVQPFTFSFGMARGGVKKRVTQKKPIKRRIRTHKRYRNKTHTKKRNHKRHTRKNNSSHKKK